MGTAKTSIPLRRQKMDVLSPAVVVKEVLGRGAALRDLEGLGAARKCLRVAWGGGCWAHAWRTAPHKLYFQMHSATEGPLLVGMAGLAYAPGFCLHAFQGGSGETGLEGA